jgi:hypothetical protein
MSLLDEPRYNLNGAAKKLKMSRRTFDRNVLPKIRVIRHSPRFIEVPESSLEDYMSQCLTAGTPPVPKTPETKPEQPAQVDPAAKKKSRRTKRR